jgi:putative acetyltransferase
MPTNPPNDLELIREATENELPLIREIHVQAFGGRLAEATLVELLHKAGKANPSLVTGIEGRIVAHLVFSPISIDGAESVDTKVAGLGPVAVLPTYQRRGIGSRLIQAGLDACQAHQLDAIVVLGSPRFYGRFGFRPAMDFGLSNEYVNNSDFMIRELRSDVLPRLRGMVRYGPEFRLAGC